MEAGEGQILGNFQEGVVLKYAQHGSAFAPSPPSWKMNGWMGSAFTAPLTNISVMLSRYKDHMLCGTHEKISPPEGFIRTQLSYEITA